MRSGVSDLILSEVSDPLPDKGASFCTLHPKPTPPLEAGGGLHRAFNPNPHPQFQGIPLNSVIHISSTLELLLAVPRAMTSDVIPQPSEMGVPQTSTCNSHDYLGGSGDIVNPKPGKTSKPSIML